MASGVCKRRSSTGASRRGWTSGSAFPWWYVAAPGPLMVPVRRRSGTGDAPRPETLQDRRRQPSTPCNEDLPHEGRAAAAVDADLDVALRR